MQLIFGINVFKRRHLLCTIISDTKFEHNHFVINTIELRLHAFIFYYSLVHIFIQEWKLHAIQSTIVD